MKRKILSALLALACVCGLTACGGEEQTGSEANVYETADVQSLVDAGAFSEELEELDGDMAFALYKLADYGLSREDLTDCAILRSAGATCEEVAVLAFGANADKVEQALKDYVQNQIDTNVDYRPAEIPKLENAVIDRRGDTFLLLVASDYEAAKGVTE